VILKKVALDPPDPIANHRDDVGPELEAIALRCLQKDPAARYRRAADVASDLERWLASPAASPRPPRRLGPALGAVGLLAVGAVGGAALVGSRPEVPSRPPIVVAPPAAKAPAVLPARHRETPDEHVASAERLRANERFIEALEECAAALDLDRACVPALHCRALIRIQKHDELERAIADLTNAIAFVPSSAALWADRARARLDTLDVSQIMPAFDDAERAVALAPGDASALSARGRARIIAMTLDPKLLRQARADLDQALELERDHAEASAYRSLLRTIAHDTDGAIEDAERATRKAPRQAAGWAMLAMALQERDRSRSLESLQKAIDLAPWDPLPLLTRGNMLAEDGDVARATEDWKRVLELAPRWAWAPMVRRRIEAPEAFRRR
jgi:tetratricopeptide (TPR) repeat protein